MQRKLPHDVDHWKSAFPKCPQQSNDFDCGVFVCAFGVCLSAGDEFQFSQNDIPELRKLVLTSLLNKCLD